jgi:hypothetical protein
MLPAAMAAASEAGVALEAASQLRRQASENKSTILWIVAIIIGIVLISLYFWWRVAKGAGSVVGNIWGGVGNAMGNLLGNAASGAQALFNVTPVGILLSTINGEPKAQKVSGPTRYTFTPEPKKAYDPSAVKTNPTASAVATEKQLKTLLLGGGTAVSSQRNKMLLKEAR